VAVPKLGESGCSERDFGERRQPLINETAQRGSLVALRIDVRD
jgi:hypothetical protein